MSNETQEQIDQSQSAAVEESNAPAPTTGLDVAFVEGRFVRLLEGIEIPEGSEVYAFDDLESLTLTKLGEIYGDLAGVTAKKFRSPKIAVESIAFQLKKKTPTNPWAPKVATKAAEPAGEKGEKKDKPKKEPTSATITLLAPEDLADQLKKLAPQAREIIGILSELALLGNTSTFTSETVSKAINEPKSVERLRTRQSPDRILAYYRSVLISSGIIKVS